MLNKPDDLCVCCSGKSFARCCLPFLSGNQYPKTPEKLMRSRFSAYALGGYGHYLLSSWLPELTQSLSAVDLSVKDTHWKTLRVISSQQKGDKAIVVFAADYLEKDIAAVRVTKNDADRAKKDSKIHTYHEQSLFLRNNGRWFYAGIAVE